MADKRRFLDVWLVETNTVYREVPFAVVADWVQQSRLLPEDMLRPSGTAQWFRVGASPEFAPYVPRSEPYRVDDQAEALEPVQLDFAWKPRREDEDDDVDMIPLIDISLVLLIFFIMTGGVAGAFLIDTPGAFNGLKISDQKLVWIGIDLDSKQRTTYSLGTGDKAPEPEDKRLTSVDQVIARLQEKNKKLEGPVDVTIRANKKVDSGDVRDLIVKLTALRAPNDKEGRRWFIPHKYITVSDKD
ncbi:MAG TPA: biopolymer transporter ExbD [Gemmataceae bacterium]|nr:biopolymer transporter ExbD [Gemmataceae bacterium]